MSRQSLGSSPSFEDVDLPRKRQQINRDWHRPPQCTDPAHARQIIMVKNGILGNLTKVGCMIHLKLPSPKHNACEGSRRCCGERRSLPSESSSLTGRVFPSLPSDNTRLQNLWDNSRQQILLHRSSRASETLLKLYGQAEEQSPQSADFCF